MKNYLIIAGVFAGLIAFFAFTNWLASFAAEFISLVVIGAFVVYGVSIIVKDLRNAR